MLPVDFLELSVGWASGRKLGLRSGWDVRVLPVLLIQGAGPSSCSSAPEIRKNLKQY